MRQLALDLKLADFAVFGAFHPGPNVAVVRALRDAAEAPGARMHWIWGGAGTGRSHLLQAVVAAAGEAGYRCAWLPLGTPRELQPGMLEGLGSMEVICADDIDAVAGQPEWEAALFRLFEELRANAGRLVVSATGPPAAAGFRLPDLASRLASGPVWKLRPLDDAEMLAALQCRARWRGLELTDEAGRYLLTHAPRAPRALFGLLDHADRAALEAHRRLTVPFLRSVLAESG